MRMNFQDILSIEDDGSTGFVTRWCSYRSLIFFIIPFQEIPLGLIAFTLIFLSLPYPIKTWLPWENLWYDSDFMHDSHDTSGMNKIMATYQGFDSYRVRYDEFRKILPNFQAF